MNDENNQSTKNEKRAEGTEAEEKMIKVMQKIGDLAKTGYIDPIFATAEDENGEKVDICIAIVQKWMIDDCFD